MDAGDLGGALKQPDLSESMDPQTMKIHANMHNQQDDDLLVTELENAISPFIHVIQNFGISFGSFGPSTAIERDMKDSFVSSQKELSLLAEFLEMNSREHEHIISTDGDPEVSMMHASMQSTADSLCGILWLIGEDTLQEQDEPSSTTNYV